jgi:hypothetical protein
MLDPGDAQMTNTQLLKALACMLLIVPVALAMLVGCGDSPAPKFLTPASKNTAAPGSSSEAETSSSKSDSKPPALQDAHQHAGQAPQDKHTDHVPHWINKLKPPDGKDFQRGQRRDIQRAQSATAENVDSPPLPKTPDVAGYLSISFSKLTGFNYRTDDGHQDPAPPSKTNATQTIPTEINPTKTDPPKPSNTQQLKGDDQIPKDIKQLNGKKVAITGYMYAIDFNAGKTNEFMLLEVIPSCFFCKTPQVNQWIEVTTLDGKRLPAITDGPVVIAGTLEVGAQKIDGVVSSIYRMRIESVAGIKKK